MANRGSLLVLALLLLWPVRLAVAEEALLPAAVTATALPTDAELADCWARVQIKANPGPFQYLAYELTARGPAGVVSHVRGFMGRRDVDTRTELMTKRDLRRIMGYLRDMGALSWPAVVSPQVAKPAAKTKVKKGSPKNLGVLESADAAKQGPPSSDVPIFEFSFRLGGVENTVLVTDPEMLADRRYARYLELLRWVAYKTTGEIAYQSPAGTSGESGWIFIDSVPGAEVSVDGVKLADTTPILAYAVAPGNHTVVLENARLGLRREVKAKVQSGLTTSIEVELQ